MTEPQGTLSVWHIQNPPAEPTWYPVNSPAEGYRVIQELAAVDLRNETIIANALGLSILEGDDMVDWYSADGDDLDTWADREEMDSLTRLREEIARAAPLVDTPAGRYAHNIVNVCLMQINNSHGRDHVNDAIEDYGLEPLGWQKRSECCAGCKHLLPCMCAEVAEKIVPGSGEEQANAN